MIAIELMAVGKKLGNIYSELTLPICTEFGINQSCFDVLMFCANNPEHNTARDICAVRGIKSGIASVAIDALIKKGLLERAEDAEDRRIRRLIPTLAAQELICEGRKIQKNFISTLKSGVTPQEEEIFENVCGKILENIKLFDSEVK